MPQLSSHMQLLSLIKKLVSESTDVFISLCPQKFLNQITLIHPKTHVHRESKRERRFNRLKKNKPHPTSVQLQMVFSKWDRREGCGIGRRFHFLTFGLPVRQQNTNAKLEGIKHCQQKAWPWVSRSVGKPAESKEGIRVPPGCGSMTFKRKICYGKRCRGKVVTVLS